ncbi:VpsF family polysaccharide biosynthesis protein [Pseudorhodoplanes sp.]|uniref:VpsF family polysaccharide biosynthesis protein n=1 Tax=Pseudorhodoplanes sp. TaxID=1934341 RepID=UPI002C96C97C|nr:VpsF family polysaccharide biosynthesis protein [Pseudorhodoplanes sp.]HWV51997.1 VpsF family polysaccharide biosynthesis protein [Pseudorhodoplanes sp.]
MAVAEARITLQPRSAARLAGWLRTLIAFATVLFLWMPPSVFELLGWAYLGGGSEFQKIHFATYLLIGTTLALFLIDGLFRRNVLYLCLTDWRLIFFALTVAAVATYAILFKQLSIAPFVDTFLAALVVVVVWICLPYDSLRQLRTLLDVFFIVNIALLFFEYAAKILVIGNITPDSYEFGQFRGRAFFEGQLAAATMLGVYCIVNLISTPIRLTSASIFRIALVLASFVAIFTTGGRTAMVVSALVILLYFAISLLSQLYSGRLNKAAIIYGVVGMPVFAICVFALLYFGFFDTMISRFEYDIGSASTRQVALDLIAALPPSELWLGMSRDDLAALVQRQEALNLLAIEISWANFILACGLALTIPLFVAYVVFLFSFIPYYSSVWAILPSLFLLIVTAASNGIWAKTTVLSASLALILAFLRRPAEDAA